MKTLLAAALMIATAMAGCSGTSASSPPSASATTGGSAPPSSQASAGVQASPSKPAAAGASGSTCVFPAATDWVPIPSGVGRCTATEFDPPFSFVPGDGWKWGGAEDFVALTRDNGTTSIQIHRYGGAVVPPYCVDPPATIAKNAAADVVAWVKIVKGLNVVVTDRTVGRHAAWQLDLVAVDAPSCSSGKVGLIPLWTVAGAEIELPETLGGGEKMRVYLVEVPAGIIVFRVSVALDGPASYDQFLTEAEALFASLELP